MGHHIKYSKLLDALRRERRRSDFEAMMRVCLSNSTQAALHCETHNMSEKFRNTLTAMKECTGAGIVVKFLTERHVLSRKKALAARPLSPAVSE